MLKRESWDSWEPWKAVWQHVLVAIALSLTTLNTVVTRPGDHNPVLLRVGLAAALGSWYASWFVLRRDHSDHSDHSDDRSAHLSYLMGVAVLWAVMSAVDPAMLLVGVTALIPYGIRHMLATTLGAVALGAGWLLHRHLTTGLDWSSVLACALGMLAVVTLSGYIAMLDREGRRRRQLLSELSAAQAELAAAERQAGILTERQRLARDIHDTLTQGFASISMLLDAALADLPAASPAARRVTQAMDTARENLTESRRLIAALRPVQLDDTRLPGAIGQLLTRLHDETGIATDVIVSGDPLALDPASEAELLRIVQEALTNTRRHAAAQQVTVTISRVGDVIVVDICDDGRGFLPDTRPGTGLPTMRERTERLGGTLTIESAPGDGTTIATTVPITGTNAHPGHLSSTVDTGRTENPAGPVGADHEVASP